MKDIHALIAALVAVKVLLVTVITLIVKARKLLKEVHEGLTAVGAIKPKTPETKILKPDPGNQQLAGVAQVAPPAGDPNTEWDRALLQEIENVSRLTCCSAQHLAGEPHDAHNGTPVVVSIEGLRRMALWGLSKAREQGQRDARVELTKGKPDVAPPAGEKPPSASA